MNIEADFLASVLPGNPLIGWYFVFLMGVISKGHQSIFAIPVWKSPATVC